MFSSNKWLIKEYSSVINFLLGLGPSLFFTFVEQKRDFCIIEVNYT